MEKSLEILEDNSENHPLLDAWTKVCVKLIP